MHKKLAAEIGRLLKKKRRTVSIAESCTGGLVSSAVTEVPGSSAYFIGTIVAYHNGVKSSLLDVPKQLLSRYGAVSAETARSLAGNVRKKLVSDYGLAVTGIAGPTGGSKAKPVGLVYVGLATKKESTVKKFIFKGSRLSVRNQAVQKALAFLKQTLLATQGS